MSLLYNHTRIYFLLQASTPISLRTLRTISRSAPESNGQQPLMGWKSWNHFRDDYLIIGKFVSFFASHMLGNAKNASAISKPGSALHVHIMPTSQPKHPAGITD
jgi:hypothetical protein